MGHIIIKPVRDEDFYIEYSSIVDSPVFGGDRATMLQRPAVDEKRLDRADVRGTSSFIGEGAWNEETIWVREGVEDPTKPQEAWHGEVKREDMQTFYNTVQGDGMFHPPAGMVNWIIIDD